jgi:hypothetical protein
MGNIRHFRELEVYQLAPGAATELFEARKRFPLFDKLYENIQGMLVNMLTHPERWSIR